MAGEAMSAFVRFFVKDEVSDGARKVEQSAKDAASGMDRAADSAGGKLKSGLEKAKSAAVTAAKGLGALGAAAGAGVAAALALCGEETQNYTQNMNMLKTSADAVGVSQEKANQAYQNFLGLTGDSDQATEAAQDMLNLAQAGGDIDKWYDIAAGTVARFGDALPVENLIESANETIRTGKIVGSMADAVNWASASSEQWKSALGGNKAALKAFEDATSDGMSAEDAFNEALAACKDEGERAALTQAALNEIYGETGQAFNQNNKAIADQRKAQDNWNRSMASAAEAVRPFVTALLDVGASMLTGVTPYIQQAAETFQNSLIPAVQTVAGVVLPPLQAAFSWLVDNLAWIAPLVIGVATAFLTFTQIIPAVTGAIGELTTLRSTIGGITGAFNLLKVAFMANPFGIIIAVISGLVAAFVYLWNTNEGFRNAVIGIWNAIKSTAVSVFGAIGSFIGGVWNGINSATSAVWNGIKSVITAVVSGIASAVSAYVNTVKSVWTAVFNAVKSVTSSIFGGIKSVISGAMNGIKGVISNVLGVIKGVFRGLNVVKSTVSGIFNGVKSAISGPMGKARDLVKGVIDKIKGFFNFKFKWPHVPMPHFTISPAGWKAGDLIKGKIPTLGIDFYAKGAVLNKPTAFGVNGSSLMVGGEAGPEAVAPIATLQGYVRAAVAEAMASAPGGYTANTYITTGETSEAKLAAMIDRRNRKMAYDLGAL